uniref:molybdopterin-dependent oxidoreductase n=1 Tax=Actinomyces viscosus TaxID=1656 RepID=UPI0028E1E232
EARAQVERAWNMGPEHHLPTSLGRDATGILSALLDGTLGGAVVGGIDLRDFPDPGLARAALAASGFTVQLEVRRSEVSEHADVVLPVAPAVEKNGTFVNWEGRVRPFGQAHVSRARTDRQVLGMLAGEIGVDLQVDDLVTLHEQLAALGLWRGQRMPVAFGRAPTPGAGAAIVVGGVEARLTTHKPMLDAGRLQDGEPFLAATALRPVAKVGADLARRLSLVGGDEVTVSTATGSITLPAVVGGVGDGTVWLPECSAGSTVHQTLGAGHGSQVTLTHAAEVLR